MKFLLFTKSNCHYCVKAKALLEKKGFGYFENEIGKDITREDFIALYPNQRTVPLIILNDEKLGGYDELAKYFDQQG